jgi:hypothetical protein
MYHMQLRRNLSIPELPRCQARVQAALDDIELEQYIPGRQAVLDSITKAVFKADIDVMKAERSVGDPAWSKVLFSCAIKMGEILVMMMSAAAQRV